MSQSRHRALAVSRNSASHAVLRAVHALGKGRHFLTDDVYPEYRKIAPPSRISHCDFSDFAFKLDMSGLVTIRIGTNYSTIELTTAGIDELFLLDNPPHAISKESVSTTKIKLTSCVSPPRDRTPVFGPDRTGPVVRGAHIRAGADDHRACPSRTGQHITPYTPHI